MKRIPHGFPGRLTLVAVATGLVALLGLAIAHPDSVDPRQDNTIRIGEQRCIRAWRMGAIGGAGDSSSRARRLWWAALGIIPGLVVEYRLISRLDSPSEDERDAATKRLVELGSVRAIPKLLYTGDAAFRICRARGAAAVPTILRIIDEGTHRVQAARLLAEIGPEAEKSVPRLIALLDDPQPKARAYAAEALCEINAGNEQALSKLRQWVVDPDGNVSWDASRVIHSLGEGARPFIPELVEYLRRNAGSEGHDPWARWALCALGREAALAVAPLLDDPSEEVRLAAVDVIGSAGREAPSLIPLLVRFLRDSSPDARTKVIQELEYMGAAAREAAPALVDIVQAESRELAWKAMISLARIGEWSGQAIPAALERMEQERPTFPMDVLQDLLFALNDHGPLRRRSCPSCSVCCERRKRGCGRAPSRCWRTWPL